MSVDDIRARRARALPFLLVLSGALAIPFAALAQEDDDDAPSVTGTESESTEGPQGQEAPTEEVVVTGSRLTRDTYTSISPLQVISGQVSREIGLIDAGTILQESTAASGVQIDLTFQGFVLDNGPAATTVDLRGLGADRTLFLINGRRLAPSGVEGAPSSPDINLIPSSLVQQYEVLLDGASSVYGSDAVAGVVNVILRKDFDGLEIEGYSSIPAADYSAGVQNTISLAWGYNGDRGFLGVGAEYRDLEPVTLADREWTDRCARHWEVTEDGEIRHEDQYYSQVLGMEPRSNSDCAVGSLSGYMTELSVPLQLGSLVYRPGFGQTSLTDYVDYNAWSTVVDLDGDGYADGNFYDRNMNGNEQFAQIIPDLSTTSALAYGEYTFAGEANITPYFEAMYSRRESYQNSGASQLFPSVPGENPFNPCNPNAVGGVDCGIAYDEMLDNPTYAADFAEVQGLTPAEFRDFGIINIYSGPLGPIPVQPVVAVTGDRNITDVTLDQLRFVGGVRGDMPFIDFGTVRNWQFDAYYSHTQSDGRSSRPGVRGDRLDYALGWYSATSTPCQNDTGLDLPDDMTLNCVPVNMFARSLMNPIIGDFATQAERAYLFDTRDFDTEYKQTIASAYANGEVFPLPGGEALFGIGAEYRLDEIDSIPDDVAAEGLFFGFFSDRGAVGDKTTKEAFAEIELPILAGITGFQELTVNASTRYTDDEFYGGAWTYSTKLAWRPIDSLMLRGTVGTSYRAPNLRENFLLGQTGFLNLTDPCVVPQAAYDPINGYNPANDNRPPEVLANCVADGIDPTTFTNGGNSVYSVEVEGGGALDLAEEKSDSFSAGFTWEQPFFTAFDFVVSATYYEIDIRDEIIEPSAAFIIQDCYYDLEGDSAFCDRIDRGADSTMSLVDQGFINRDQGRARGVDVNMRVDWPTQMFGKAVDLAAELAANRALELSSKLVGQGGSVEEEEYVGEFGFPEWKGRLTLRADVGSWRYTWSTRYISSVAEDPLAVDPFDDVFTGLADTCLGPANGDVNCRNVGYAENYFVHDASIYYYGDTWTIGGGLRNVFNEDPPLVDGASVFSFNNVPFGAGYDILGRTLFANVVYNWQ
ncbi:MAG TPA: TonB-dependent receptor [Woeseiaceae bacterium]|nr:TonB-dependent receptor [Woeseiaceae bacterium]